MVRSTVKRDLSCQRPVRPRWGRSTHGAVWVVVGFSRFTATLPTPQRCTPTQRNATPCKRFLKLFSKPLVFKRFQHVETGLPDRVIPGCQRATLASVAAPRSHLASVDCRAAAVPTAAATAGRRTMRPGAPSRPLQTPLDPLRHSDRASQYHPPPVQQRSGIVRTLLITWPTANPDRLVNVSVWPDAYSSMRIPAYDRPALGTYTVR